MCTSMMLGRSNELLMELVFSSYFILLDIQNMEEQDSPPGTVMDSSTPAGEVGSSTLSIKSPTPSQKAREWEKRINQSMGGK